MGDAARALSKGPTIEMDGRSYTLTPFNLDMIAMFEAWLEDQAYARVERCRGQIPDDEYQRRLRTVTELVGSMAFSFGSEAYSKAMESLPGKKQMLWLMLTANDRTITRAQIDSLFADNLELALGKLQAAIHAPKAAGEASPSP
ncbi:MAG: hypothetical protein AB7K24_05720 [Gemmataceae bacterium]